MLQDNYNLKNFLSQLKDKYYKLKSNAINRKIQFELSFDDFVDFFLAKNNSCYYCGITEKELNFLYHTLKTINLTDDFKWAKRYTKTNNLTIDRVNNRRGYVKDNIVKSCLICNYVKNDLFNQDEMIIIGSILKIKYQKLIEEIRKLNVPIPMLNISQQKLIKIPHTPRKKVLLNILKKLIRKNKKIFRSEVFEIAKEIKLQKWSVQKYMDEFCKGGIFKKNKKGRRVFYTNK